MTKGQYSAAEQDVFHWKPKGVPTFIANIDRRFPMYYRPRIEWLRPDRGWEALARE